VSHIFIFFLILTCAPLSRQPIEELLKLLPGPHLDLKRVSGYCVCRGSVFGEAEFFFLRH
jgi:hypothetical protein